MPESAPPIIPADTNAEAAYERQKALIFAVPEDDLAVLNVDLDKAAKGAYQLAARGVQADLWPRLARLPVEEFDAATELPLLADLALAGSWIVTMGLSVRAGSNEALLPESLVQESRATRSRMLSTCEYCLDESVEVMIELASIRAGQGHDDLKHDLRRLAVLYRAHADELSGKKYRASDAELANQLAGQIQLRQKGTSAEEQRQLERRVWTLVKKKGERAHEAATFVTYAQPGVRASLPTLYGWRPTRAQENGKSPAQPAPEPVA